MKVLGSSKKRIQITEFNRDAANGRLMVENDEKLYSERIKKAASEVISSGRCVLLLSGPSGSGKTTSPLKLAQELLEFGTEAQVVSLDDFFKNVNDYPETPEGTKDYESVYSLDIDLINEKLYDLVTTGHTEIPQFDFIFQMRKPEMREVQIKSGGVVIVEGIHALNPLLSESIGKDDAFRIYAGLCSEYYDRDERLIATRDVRITRRMIRDHYFRGHSVEKTLELWDNLLEGEVKWIRIFKPEADLHLDTSLDYEVCIYGSLLEEIYAGESEAGAFRAVFTGIMERFLAATPIDIDLVPDNSMLREFLGGLIL